MRYVIITAILALGLAGCNLNGLSFDTSALPNLNIGEVNCNDCNVNVNTADTDQSVETHYYVISETSWYLGQNPDYELQPMGWSSWITEHNWYYGSKEANDKAYGNVPRRVNVDGDSGLFIEYNYNPNTEHPNGTEYSGALKEAYLVAGGNIEPKYTPMPSGNYQYNGNVVSKSVYNNTFSNGTVNAEVNFTDSNVASIEFDGTGTGADRRFENIGINSETGTFLGAIDSNNETTTISKDTKLQLEDGVRFEAYVSGTFFGAEAKGLTGIIFGVLDPELGTLEGVFAAERSDTQVVAEN